MLRVGQRLRGGIITSTLVAALSSAPGCLDTVDENAWKSRDIDAAVHDSHAVDVLSCGTIGAPCCAGDSCTEGNCVAGVCQSCGGLGQPCCPGRQCAEGLCTGTAGGTCTACGTAGQACCVGNSCNDSGCCVDGTCVAAGSPCPGIGGTCANGSCGTCGGVGDPCCTGDVCTGSSLICASGTCVSCGGAGEPCCPGNTCTSTTLICAAGTCTACGGESQPCCAGGICSGVGLVCNATNTCELVLPDAGVDTTPPVDLGPDPCATWAGWTCFTASKLCQATCPNATSPAYSVTCNPAGCRCDNAALQTNTCSTPPTDLTCSNCQAAVVSGCCLGL